MAGADVFFSSSLLRTCGGVRSLSHTPSHSPGVAETYFLFCPVLDIGEREEIMFKSTFSKSLSSKCHSQRHL